jgi:hypothetical protein
MLIDWSHLYKQVSTCSDVQKFNFVLLKLKEVYLMVLEYFRISITIIYILDGGGEGGGGEDMGLIIIGGI